MAFLRHEFIHLYVLTGLAEVSPDGPLSTPLNVVGFGHSHPVRKNLTLGAELAPRGISKEKYVVLQDPVRTGNICRDSICNTV